MKTKRSLKRFPGEVTALVGAVLQLPHAAPSPVAELPASHPELVTEGPTGLLLQPIVVAAIAAGVFATLAYLWWRIPSAVPVVESVTQLTNDNEAKDWYAPIETDGARVYFTEKYAGSFRLAQVAASGGHVAQVPTQIAGAYRASIAPDFSGLLVTEYPIGRHLVWFQPLPPAMQAAREHRSAGSSVLARRKADYLWTAPRSTSRIEMVRTPAK